jgi:hypothetical protein
MSSCYEIGCITCKVWTSCDASLEVGHFLDVIQGKTPAEDFDNRFAEVDKAQMLREEAIKQYWKLEHTLYELEHGILFLKQHEGHKIISGFDAVCEYDYGDLPLDEYVNSLLKLG